MRITMRLSSGVLRAHGRGRNAAGKVGFAVAKRKMGALRLC
jgi:hypothetical protein